MKRFFLGLAILFLPVILAASPVSESRCRSIAAEFFSGRDSRFSPSSLALLGQKTTVKSGIDSPAYFIYRNGASGFVIVSGDDSVPAILGYSDKGSISIDNAPANFKEWMGMWEAIIADRRATGATQSADFSNYRTAAKVGAEDKLQYETARWGQDAPYNNLCPGGSVSGCGATATCIVLRYHKWPDNGVKDVPGYTTATKKYNISKIPVADQEYDWEKMTLSYNSASTQDEKDAVAKLMYHVGVMLQSDYSPDGTSTYPSDLASVLRTYLKYDASVIAKEADYYPADKWVEMLKESLETNGPIIYTAQSSSQGGHAFVVDGYEGNKLHINWGWDGSNDGHYIFPNFDPFTQGHYVIFNLKKDEGGTQQDDIVLYKVSQAGNSGIIVSGTIEPDKSFSANINAVANFSEKAFSGQIALARVDKNENIKEVTGAVSSQLNSLADHSYSLNSCKLTGPFNTGDRLMAVYSSSVTTNWTILRYDRTDPSIIGEIPLADAQSIEESTKLKYVLADKKISLTFKTGVEVQLLDSKENPVSGVVSKIDNKNATIDVSALSSGQYTIKLTKDTELKLITVKL